MKTKIITLEKLCKIADFFHAENKKIAATSGCFDVLHAGHVAYLEEARAFGDALVVMLNSDDSVRGLKGTERPIVPQNERAQVLAGLWCVDYVCIFDEATPCPAYAAFKPDFVVKGGDYRGKRIPEMDTLSEYGGKVEYVDFVDGCSTTNIVEKIKRLCKGEK